MKKHALALLCLAVLGAPYAHAQDGRSETVDLIPDGLLIFSGAIVKNTCTVDESTKLQLVELPYIGVNSLSATGDTAGFTPFSIKLKNCNLGDVGFPYLHFQGREVDPDTGNLANLAHGNTGVQIQLLSDHIPINLHTNMPPLPEYRSDSGNDTDFTLEYAAQYYVKDNNLQPGPVLSMVDYVIAYQ